MPEAHGAREAASRGAHLVRIELPGDERARARHGAPVTSRRPGRPRAALDAAIAGATVRLLSVHGYRGLSMGAVAASAGIGKPTLYRRYPTKADLVAAVLLGLDPVGLRPELPGDTRRALGVLLASTARAVASPGGLIVLGSLLAEASADPSLLAAFRAAVFRPQQEVVHGVVRAGIERGDVREDVDVEAVDAMLFGALLARAILGEPVDAAWARRVVDAAWPALATGTDGAA
jgi:AcrR family transcriptional regulator